MTSDVVSIVSQSKYGSIIVSCLPTGRFSKDDQYSQNSPSASDIENKYTNRFDDKTYYTDSSVVDGGGL
jgi:hypothetical protein